MSKLKSILLGAALVGAVAAAGVPALAQDFRPPAGPNPALIAAQAKPTPKTAWGSPDLTGTWSRPEPPPRPNAAAAKPANANEVCVLGCNVGEGPPPGQRAAPERPTRPEVSEATRPDRPKYKAEFIGKVRELEAGQVKLDPTLKCGNPGLPRIGPPDKVVQNKDQVVFLYDDLSGSFWRIVQLNKNLHEATYERGPLGQSIGHWEGDTLVVVTDRLSDDTWLVDDGAFHTEGLSVTERFRRVGDSLQYEVISDDQAVLAEPWKQTINLVLDKRDPYQPVPCVDQTLDLIVDGTHHNNAR